MARCPGYSFCFSTFGGKLSINLFIYGSGPNDEKIEDVLFMQIQILNLEQCRLFYAVVVSTSMTRQMMFLNHMVARHIIASETFTN